MKITVYTVTDCQFSKQEKDYLSANNLQFEEKNLEINKDYLTEMMTVGNNFAGTPVTKIEKDDGKTVVLKGFSKEDFDRELGLAKTEPVAASDILANMKLDGSDQPTTPGMPTPSPVEPPATPSVPPSTPPVIEPSIPEAPKLVEPTTPPAAQPSNDALSSILSDLQNKSQQAPSTSSVTTGPVVAPTGLPNIPDFSTK